MHTNSCGTSLLKLKDHSSLSPTRLCDSHSCKTQALSTYLQDSAPYKHVLEQMRFVIKAACRLLSVAETTLCGRQCLFYTALKRAREEYGSVFDCPRVRKASWGPAQVHVKYIYVHTFKNMCMCVHLCIDTYIHVICVCIYYTDVYVCHVYISTHTYMMASIHIQMHIYIYASAHLRT